MPQFCLVRKGYRCRLAIKIHFHIFKPIYARSCENGRILPEIMQIKVIFFPNESKVIYIYKESRHYNILIVILKGHGNDFIKNYSSDFDVYKASVEHF